MKNQQYFLLNFLEEWYSGKDISARTSGSTGIPKEILLPRSHIIKSAKRTCNFFRINKNSRIHSCISFEFIGGKMMIARSLVSGCSLSYSEPALNINGTIKGNQIIDLMSVVPAQMFHIVSNFKEYSFVKRFLIGGSPIDNRLWDKIVACGVEAWESYGMTETASHIALRRVIGDSKNRPRFVPFKDVALSLDHEDCLHIKDGDINVITNDCCKVAPDGSFQIVGRKDEMIITGGIKVLPYNLEERLWPYLSKICRALYITSVPDEVWTNKIVLVCEPYDINENTVEVIKNIIKEIPDDKIPHKLKPKEFYIVKEIPYSKSGKIIRKSPVL